jgi:enoyl-CoA hydratase
MSEQHYQPLVLSERQGAILILTLNRPEKSNSLHPELIAQLGELLEDAATDSAVSVLILTGAGKVFSAGLDLGLLAAWTASEKLGYLDHVVKVFWRIWNLPQPVIAAVNGPAIAGGFDLAAFCDIRLASPQARFGQAEINLGLTQIIHPLYKSIGLSRAKELAMTGQNISAEEAYRIGLVNHLYPADELMPQTMKLAAVLASKPRDALFETKRLTRELLDLNTQQALDAIGESFVRLVESVEHQQRVSELYASLRKTS